MQFLITLDTDNREKFASFVRMMKELEATWEAPYHNGEAIVGEPDLEYSEYVQDLIRTNDPLVAELPEDHVESAKDVIKDTDADIQHDASEFPSKLQEHADALSVAIGAPVSIQSVTYDGLVCIKFGPLPERTHEIKINHHLYPGYAHMVEKVVDGKYIIILEPAPHMNGEDHEYFRWAKLFYPAMKTFIASKQ